MWKTRLKIANMVYFKMLHLQVTYEIQNQRQEDTVRIRTTHVCSNFVDVQKANRTAMQSKKYFARPRFPCEWITSSSILGNVSWKHYSVSHPGETLSVTHAKESFRLIHVKRIHTDLLRTGRFSFILNNYHVLRDTRLP